MNKPDPEHKRTRPPAQGPRRHPVVVEPKVEPSSRYTPPKRFTYIFRPGWHKAVGAALLVGGVSLFVSCEANLGNIHAFGGHIWYLVGLAVAASSAWWFGALDQPA